MRWFLGISVSVMAWSGTVGAHTGDVYFAQPAKGIVVDGDLGEWAAAALVEAGLYDRALADLDDAKDFSVRYAVAWKGDRLFVAARVSDDVHVNEMDIFADQGDRIAVSIGTNHVRYVRSGATNVSLALASSGDSTVARPGEEAEGTRVAAHAIVRDDAAGETRYEAEVMLDRKVREGEVMAFRFTARDNDGFPDGQYVSTIWRTLPPIGTGDLVLVGKAVKPATVTGSVTGIGGTDGPTYVHLMDGARIVASDICDEKGAFELRTVRQKGALVAVQGNRRSARATVSKAGAVVLKLNESLGSIAGRVVKENGVVGVPLANVVAVQRDVVASRVAADHAGHYTITGLDDGEYDLLCGVARNDTIHAVSVSAGVTTRVRDFVGDQATFDRPLWSDDVFDAVASVFSYDRRQPFNAEVVETREIDEHVRHEVMISSSRGERFPAYIALPKSDGPFPCLVTLHAGSIIGKERSDFELIRRLMTREGYAVAAIDAKRFNVRRVNDDSGWNWQDATIQTIVDHRRLIDYLSSRDDIDSTRIGIYGGSMGVRHGLMLAGVDDRVKAFVMRGPGAGEDRWNDPVSIGDQLQYAPHMPSGMPKILFTGYYDRPWAVQGTLRLLEELDAPAEVVWYQTTHTVPPQLYMDRMVAWVKENL